MRNDRPAVRFGAVLFLSTLTLLAAMPAVGVLGQEEDPAPRESAMEALEGILTRLEEALVRLDEVEIPELERQLEAIAGLLGELLVQLEEGDSGGEPTTKEQVVKLDIMLHRLIHTLERLVARQEANEPPSQEELRAREALENLRIWINGYVDGLTQHLRPSEAREFERMAGALLQALNRHVARIVHAAIEKHEDPTRLELLLQRVQDLVARLDAFIVRHFGRPVAPPRPRGP